MTYLVDILAYVNNILYIEWHKNDKNALNCRLNAVLHSFQGMSYSIVEDPTVTEM